MWWHLWWQQTLTPRAHWVHVCGVTSQTRFVPFFARFQITLGAFQKRLVCRRFFVLFLFWHPALLICCLDKNTIEGKHLCTVQPNKHTVHCLSAEVGHKIISNMIRFADDLHAHSTVFFPTQQLNTVKQLEVCSLLPAAFLAAHCGCPFCFMTLFQRLECIDSWTNATNDCCLASYIHFW